MYIYIYIVWLVRKINIAALALKANKAFKMKPNVIS